MATIVLQTAGMPRIDMKPVWECLGPGFISSCDMRNSSENTAKREPSADATADRGAAPAFACTLRPPCLGGSRISLSSSDPQLTPVPPSNTERQRNPVGHPQQKVVRLRECQQADGKCRNRHPGDRRHLDHKGSFTRTQRVLDAEVGADRTPSPSHGTADYSADQTYVHRHLRCRLTPRVSAAGAPAFTLHSTCQVHTRCGCQATIHSPWTRSGSSQPLRASMENSRSTVK
jgi:hypothetical protein